MTSMIFSLLIEAIYLIVLLMFINWQRHRTPINKDFLVYQGFQFVGFAVLLVLVGLGIQSYGVFGIVLTAPENTNLAIAVAAMLYVVPAVAAAIGANILTQYVLLGP